MEILQLLIFHKLKGEVDVTEMPDGVAVGLEPAAAEVAAPDYVVI